MPTRQPSPIQRVLALSDPLHSYALHKNEHANNTERKEYRRNYARERARTAKAIGKCKNCSNPSNPDQTRCETCAEKHRQARRRSDSERSARKKEELELDS